MVRKILDVGKRGGRTGFKKEELLSALDKVGPGLSRQEPANCYLFMGDRIASYSEDVCVVAKFSTGLSGMVKADEFHKLVSSTPGDTIHLELKKNQVVVEAGKDFSFGMAHMEPGELHEKAESLADDELKWRPFTEEAKRAIVLCSFTASKDAAKPALSGVYVGEGEVLSSDNCRISWYRLEEGMRRSFLVPAVSVVHLVGYNLGEYALSDSWVHFRGEGIVYSARLLAEEFPQKAREFFPTDEGEGFELPKDLAKVMDKALILQQDVPLLDKRVSLVFDGNKLVCEASRQDLGWVKESVVLEKGPEELVKVDANPVFLKEILKHSTRVLITGNYMLFMSDPGTTYNSKFRCLIALG